MSKKKIGIIGATGYTGSELARILLHHPEVEIAAITSESRKGERFSEVHPFFRGLIDQELISINEIENMDLDLVFLALPHGVSMDFVKEHAADPYPIIDLSGDFRLDTPEIYEAWYNKEHVYKEGFENAAYGIPELFRKDIRRKKLIANPGCYPTSAILGLAPLAKEGLIEPNVVVDSKSGTTGAGVKAKAATHFPNVNDNFRAYGVKSHRHTIEIEDTLNKIGDAPLTVQFTPHLLPVDRGIVSTIYSRPRPGVDVSQIGDIYEAYYKDEPFVRLTDQPPAIKDVRGTNYCDIYSTYDERTNNFITISAIDNLVKGAAGQAVQNMNLIFGWDEILGLQQVPMNP
ncbi:N-acetyl-gamma-glutamyl-phosphate reductase [Fulvivirga imtechensis AK7]|uniref:N-acetyl-gamma-glutamyl-phosphate reductase n=1 Tax=Fulvivirga imtechensis AK7 TaxID=1237149 RepID=L8JVU2_9BACT|nr:N-acetyl-gamma-glutamyl-phosphate reductase [Fulvivirga imtechensis]ELR73166.1 N-acetyl-gamma-glutamyl-phosphate reductase [Fulvivirga imtechensis AK7]